MKAFEKIVKDALLSCVINKMDSLQFSYKSARGVYDATGTLLNMALTHLEDFKSYEHLVFYWFVISSQTEVLF